MQRLKMMLSTSAISLLMVFTFLIPASYAAVAVPDLDIQEYFDGQFTVDFSVETIYDDIVGFAVGNNYNFNYASTSVYGWQAAVAVKQNLTDWKIAQYNPGSPPSITYFDLPSWMNLDSLEDTSAFLFYNNTGNALSSGITSGFSGYAFAPSSPFLAFRNIDGQGDITITAGETSMVPVPGALLLFGSGMIALVGMRRKKK